MPALRAARAEYSLDVSLNKKVLFLFKIPDLQIPEFHIHALYTSPLFPFPNPSQLLFFTIESLSLYDFRFSDLRFHNLYTFIDSRVSLNKRGEQETLPCAVRDPQPWATPRGAGRRPAEYSLDFSLNNKGIFYLFSDFRFTFFHTSTLFPISKSLPTFIFHDTIPFRLRFEILRFTISPFHTS